MTILITGANGYLGRVLHQKHLLTNHDYVEVDLGVFNPCECSKVNLAKDNLTWLLDLGIDTIVHLAGISNDPTSELNPQLTHSMNIAASKRLIDFASASGVKRFIFASSASVYGDNEYLVSEDAPLNPLTAYAKSKVEIEQYLGNFPNLRPVIFRFGTLFGPSTKMRFDLAINVMARDALLHKKVTVIGTGEQFRPFLHVNDAARMCFDAANRNYTGIYNLATSNIRINSLADMISGIVNCPVEYQSVDHPDHRNYKMDCTRAARELGFDPSLTLLYGARQIMLWTKEHDDSMTNINYYTIEAWKEFLKDEKNCTIF